MRTGGGDPAREAHGPRALRVGFTAATSLGLKEHAQGGHA
jgi:hypothetical protein